ncbi:MAG: TetR/AcrR family transcriptional regulator [Firmicutes bacterium]|nr:TetR/AcrR family transcriptional regulator [Bacillota bacterium]MBQ6810830.1 TetR/AcrR family transcriptional regulator [Bacillota bacterium]
MKKKTRNTKAKIVSAAWKLFYEQGYEATTVEEIIEESGTSRGSFYHYFEGKDALLSSLSFLFDEEYEAAMEDMDEHMEPFEMLMYLNYRLFHMIENRVSIDLISRLYSTQLVTKGHRHLLDHNRVYYKLLRSIVVKGQESGAFRTDWTAAEIVKLYALEERALIYDWCLCNGEYSMSDYSKKVFPGIMSHIKAEFAAASQS